jgi:hypothetical protein
MFDNDTIVEMAMGAIRIAFKAAVELIMVAGRLPKVRWLTISNLRLIARGQRPRLSVKQVKSDETKEHS